MTTRLVILLPALLGGCAAMTPETVTPSSSARVVTQVATHDPHSEAIYQLIVGELSGRKGELKSSAHHYLEAARLSRDPRVAERALRIALFAKDQASAEQALALWAELEPQSNDRWQLESVLLMRSGRTSEAAALLDVHIPTDDALNDVLRKLAALLVREGEQAVEVMQKLAERRPQEPRVWLSLAEMALHFKQVETARTALAKVTRLQPKRKEPWLMLAGTYFSAGQIDEGLKLVREAVTRFQDDQSLRLDYARALVEAGRLDEARPMFAHLLRNNPKNQDLRFAVALLALNTRDFTTAETELRKLQKSPSHADEAAYYLGRMEEQRGNPERARQWYEKVRNNDMRLDAIIRIANLDARTGRLEQARADLAKARARLTEDGPRVQLYLAETELLRKAKQTQAAFELLSKALLALPGQPDLLYNRALLADQLDNFPQAEADLRAILEQDPDHPEALNALGYIMAKRNIRLDDAYALIDKALKLAPDNPAFLDSMGWVLYRQGDINKAEEYLRRAYNLDTDGEIAAHLITVLLALQRNEEARFLLTKALEREPERAELLELKKILQQP